MSIRWTKDKETILVLVLALLVWYRASRHPVLLWIAGALVIIGLLAPPAARVIHAAWMKLSIVMGTIMSTLILTIIFFIVILPLGTFSRLFGKNELITDPTASSCFRERDHTFTKTDLEQPW